MTGFSTALPTSFKQEIMQGQHCLNASGTQTGTTANGSSHLTALNALTAIAIGCSVAGTNIPANAFVGAIDSSNTIYITQQATGSSAGVTFTFLGHDFKCALGIVGPAGTYGAATTNYSNLTGNSDEVASGAGYTTGGFDFGANNTTPTTSGTTGFTTPAVNASWTSATFSTTGCIIYNSSNQNKAVYVGSFGGTQTVTAGTFTLIMPTNNSTNALFRIA